MMEDKCPFCGADNLGFPISPESHGIIVDIAIPGYKCGTKGMVRSQDCYERQLATQAEMLKLTLEVVEEKAGDYYTSQGRETLGKLACGECHAIQGKKHRNNCAVGLAQALLPDLRRAVEGKA